MPRVKRNLVEADPDASAPAPTSYPKRSQVGIALGKEVQPFKSKTVAELSIMLKARGLPLYGQQSVAD